MSVYLGVALQIVLTFAAIGSLYWAVACCQKDEDERNKP